MQIIKCLNKDDYKNLKKRLRISPEGCVAALGFFDGVHIAHRALLAKARAAASEKGIPLLVFTFIGANNKIKPGAPRIYTDEGKSRLLGECGADVVLLCDFDSVSGLSKEEFVGDFLTNTLNAKIAVCGFNFRFSKGASACAKDLKELMESYKADAIIVPEFLYGGEAVSSTRIRGVLESGDMRSAAVLLGKPYFLSGYVAHGNGMGASFGIPTVNTELNSTLFIPPKGVYNTVTEIGGALHHSITNIGLCPTFGERALHAETFIIDYEGDLYGTDVRIYLLDFIREEKTFSGEKDLIAQIKVDIEKAKLLLKETKWQEIGLSLQ